MKLHQSGSRRTKEECFMSFIVLGIWTRRLSKFTFMQKKFEASILCFILPTRYRSPELFLRYRFYRECLGMKLLRQRDIPEEGYSNAFLGYGPEESNFSVELTYSKAPHSQQLARCFLRKSFIVLQDVIVDVLYPVAFRLWS